MFVDTMHKSVAVNIKLKSATQNQEQNPLPGTTKNNQHFFLVMRQLLYEGGNSFFLEAPL